MKTNLEELRKEWEKSWEVVCFLTKTWLNSDYVVHYAVLFREGRYRLNRYFSISFGRTENKWEVSVDIDKTEDAREIFKRLNKGFAEK